METLNKISDNSQMSQMNYLKFDSKLTIDNAGVAELVDALDLGSSN